MISFGEIMEQRKKKKEAGDDMMEGLLELNRENEAGKLSSNDIKHLFLVSTTLFSINITDTIFREFNPPILRIICRKLLQIPKKVTKKKNTVQP